MKSKVAMKTNLVVKKTRKKTKYGDVRVTVTHASLTLTAPLFDKKYPINQDIRLLEALEKAFNAEFTTLKIDRFNHVQITKEL